MGTPPIGRGVTIFSHFFVGIVCGSVCLFYALDKIICSLYTLTCLCCSSTGDSPCEALISDASGIRAVPFLGIPSSTGYNELSRMHARVSPLDPVWASTHRVFL